jgi:hypothetical protein
LVEALGAAILEKRVYEEQAARVNSLGAVSRAFQALFNTSKLDIGAENVGRGRRESEQQGFKKALLEY